MKRKVGYKSDLDLSGDPFYVFYIKQMQAFQFINNRKL